MLTMDSELIKSRFKRNGFVVIPNAIDKQKCSEIIDTIFEFISVDPEKPSEWYNREPQYMLSEGFISDPLSTHLNDVLTVSIKFVEILVGNGNLKSISDIPEEPCLHAGQTIFDQIQEVPKHNGVYEPILRYPEIGGRWESPTPHIDGTVGGMDFQDIDYLPFTIGATVYFQDIEPRGGGFTVWPGSHEIVSEYFSNNSYSDYIESMGVLNDLKIGPPFEISGSAGTLILWHPALAHAGSKNISPNIRFSGIQRLSTDMTPNHSEQILEDLWVDYQEIS